MDTTPEFIGAMRSYDRSHTEFAVHVRTDNLTPAAVKLDIPMGTLEREPTMDEAAHTHMRRANKTVIAAADMQSASPAKTSETVAPKSSRPWNSDDREPN
jgi:hypothetical protein